MSSPLEAAMRRGKKKKYPNYRAHRKAAGSMDSRALALIVRGHIGTCECGYCDALIERYIKEYLL